MKTLKTLVRAVLLSVLVLGCGRSSPEVPDAPKGDLNPSTAFARFVELRRSPPADFDALSRHYRADLESFVREADGRNGTDFDREITTALERGRAGKDVSANAQVAEKTVQRAFILTFSRSLDKLEKNPDDGTSLARALTCAPVIRTAALRRSRWVGKGDEYADAFDAAVSRIAPAAGGKKPGDSRSAAARLRALVNKTLVLSVFYELGGLEKARGADADKAAEKRVEAQIYHANLLEEHAKRDAGGAETVAGQLAGPIDRMDIDLVRNVLKSDFAREISDVDSLLLGLSP